MRQASRRSRRSSGTSRIGDSLLLGLVENVAREQLSPVEEARAYASLVDEFELSLGDVADRVGRSKPAVSNRLRLLELPEEVLWMLARGDMSEGHARAVLSLPDDDARRRLARRIVKEGLTVRAAERAAREGGARRRPRRVAAVDPALVDRARAAAEAITGMPARVEAGTLQIRFDDEKGSRSSSRRSKPQRRRSPKTAPPEDERHSARSDVAACGCEAAAFRDPRDSESAFADSQSADKHGRSWTRTTDLRLIRAAL